MFWFQLSSPSKYSGYSCSPVLIAILGVSYKDLVPTGRVNVRLWVCGKLKKVRPAALDDYPTLPYRSIPIETSRGAI